MVNRGIVGGLPVGGFDDVVVVVVLRRVGRLFVKSESLSLICCYRGLLVPCVNFFPSRFVHFKFSLELKAGNRVGEKTCPV